MLLLVFLAQSRDFKLCYIKNETSARIALSDLIRCDSINFIEASSQTVGGAIFVDQSSATIEIEKCLFLECASYGTITFAHECSGAALFCRISKCSVLKCGFDGCYGTCNGVVAYICSNSDRSKTSKLEDSSSANMRGYRKNDSKCCAYTTDFTLNTIKRVNFSKPLIPSNSIFFGQYSPTISINHVVIAGENTERGFELSSDNSQTDINSILFLNIIATEAIFLVWKVKYTVTDIHIINCSEKLAASIDGGKLTIKRSWIGSGISVDKNVVDTDSETYQEDSPIKITHLIEHHIYNICSMRQGRTKMITLSFFCTLLDELMSKGDGAMEQNHSVPFIELGTIL